MWSPLAQGVLTGKYAPGQAAPDDTRMGSKQMGTFMGRYDDALLARVQELLAQDGVRSSYMTLLRFVRRSG